MDTFDKYVTEVIVKSRIIARNRRLFLYGVPKERRVKANQFQLEFVADHCQ
jgi:tetrahydromethanopterin S-methyltransferase subunit F